MVKNPFYSSRVFVQTLTAIPNTIYYLLKEKYFRKESEENGKI
jgi:hypothetical protein